MSLQSLLYDPSKPSLQVLDQLLLPDEKKYVDVPNVETTWLVIRNMQIRGAPLIAVVAALGLAVDLQSNKTVSELQNITSATALQQYIQAKLDYLSTSRPTAVNLFHALADIRKKVEDVLANEFTDDMTSLTPRVVQAIQSYAEFALQRDIDDCQKIGQHGADELLQNIPSSKQLTIITICNTGSLATAGYGTALGVVRALQERNRLQQIVALETRPYNQGSRLTAFELIHDNLANATLICDSMAAAFMAQFPVDAVIVGADRVCANGDVANKIGTFNVAVVAAARHVPVYAAAPFTTLDLELTSGKEVVIEERPAEELLQTSRAPSDSRLRVWNPAFDVTPCRYLAGIITERGVIRPGPDGTFNVKEFVRQAQQIGDDMVKKSNGDTTIKTNGDTTIKINGDMENKSNGDTEAKEMATTKTLDGKSVPNEYKEQTTTTLAQFIVDESPDVCKVLGTSRAEDLECVEVGDGNLNLVFIVTNTNNSSKQVIVKQALPYVRCVGESWPLTLERSFFEHQCLVAHKTACPEFVPRVYYFSKTHGLIVMEYLPQPFIILRKGFIQGIRYPTAVSDIATFCAKVLFKTSGFHLTPTQLRQQVEFWSRNQELCALTEQVVFTEPYMFAANNRWTSPQLDDDKKAIENDDDLKIAAAYWKHKFVTETQALIHADLHSGSVMSRPEPGQTFVIDPEFAFYGPMAFDLGAFIANLFLAYVAQPGQSNGDDYADWILQQIQIFWSTFTTEFKKLWNDPAEHTGYLYGRETLNYSAADKIQNQFFQNLLKDSLGFAGMKMLRRIVGIAHVEDLECIQDIDVKARCERHGLEIAKEFIKQKDTIGDSIESAIDLARRKK